jgi:mannitol-1-phosphate/altronate dehydrogenase
VPPVKGLDWAVVAEPFHGIPVEAHALAGMAELPPAIEPQDADRFRASEDVKMLAHNALHAVLACAGHLRGAERFDQLRADAEVMELGRRLLAEEAGPALLRKHGPALPRNEYMNYCDSILRRVTCPVLRDPIARGTRGIMRKLEPWERLVHGLRTVWEVGIEPSAFALGCAMAVAIARQSGATQMAFAEVLTRHCKLDPQTDAHLIELIQRQREAVNSA